MINGFATYPDQLKLIDDVIFDLSGLPVSLLEIGVIATAAIVLALFVNAPLFTATLEKARK